MTLEQLPDRIERLESQMLQFRAEVRSEFSAVRHEAAASGEETRRSLRQETRAGDEETRRALREEIRAGDEETRRFSRVLHEDAIGRIAVVAEGLALLTGTVDRFETTLSHKIDRTDAKVDLILARLDQGKKNTTRRRK